ncbi:kinase-like protein [Suhomyces tanzawaensis NRRL Y-17324]|uniref:non-specific serine/threonine protein kinase n=1 Tax=Suhomyces tanzawaensis NRRL Y-17324 TaxID=984487 RepID=A0A1E4SRQ3_9ASCO|nr:kinase-like protein [Suhomyces tanzawaensis NRRL Y-17324]ODV82193.1 kinase-like protein [Suhomyces tanzawaensis NRRL Y-17324]
MPVPPPNAYASGTKLTVGSHNVSIIQYISEGGFAYVYTCTIDPPFHGSSIACLKRVVVPNKWQLTLLRQEVDAMRRLRGNKHIVSYIDSHASRLSSNGNSTDQQYEVFLLMEYCENNGLIDLMNTRLVDKLTEPEILKIMFEVTIGVAMCHHLDPPLIHRDIKIENVLIDSQGVFKLCDFGSSVPYIPAPKTPQELHATKDDIMNHTTPQYRAPEMIDLSKGFPIDDKLDIWALGCFLYKLCYYTTPFELPNQKSMEDLELAILSCGTTLRFHDRPGLMFSPRLKNIIKCCFREDPRRRPNAVQLLGEIAQMMGTQVPSVIPYSVKHSKLVTEKEDQPKLPLRPQEDYTKHHLKNNKPADPFSSIDKLKYLKSATVNLPTVGKVQPRPKSTYSTPKKENTPEASRPKSIYLNDKPQSKSSTSIQNYVQQALHRSSDDLGHRLEDEKGSMLEFLRSKEEESHKVNSRQNTGGSFKASLKNNLRRISTGNSINENHTGHDQTKSRSKRSSITSIKQLLTGNSFRKTSSSPEESMTDKQAPEPAKKLSIQRRMQLLMNPQETTPRTAEGYGKYTEVKDVDDIDAINSTQYVSSSEEDSQYNGYRSKNLTPPKVPDSLSTRKLRQKVPEAPRQPVQKSISVSSVPLAKGIQTSIPKPSLKLSTSSSYKKVPPKPVKPKHLKTGQSEIDHNRRLSTSSDVSVPDIDDLEKQFSKRFPSYV